ncbi:MAG: ABC-2 family transporter protein [Chloroflexi bacterium]|nr:ABC-2 family transporter protein [Chloroflexota bacterium]
MMRLQRIYAAMFVASFQQAAQYRVQAVLWLLMAVVRPVVFLAAWSAAANAQGGSIGGYTVGDFAAYYVCLTLVSQLTMAWDAYDFEWEVRQGRLAPKLLRPLHPVHYTVVENIVYKVTTLPALLPALVLIAWTFQAHFQTQPWQLVVFVPSVVAAAALRFVFGWFIASFAFWTTRIHAIMHLYDRVVFLLAGQVAPLSLLPAPLALLSYALPFGYMLWAPAEILRGGMSFEQAMLTLGAQLVWLVLSWLAYVVVWRLGLRQFSAVGA